MFDLYIHEGGDTVGKKHVSSPFKTREQAMIFAQRLRSNYNSSIEIWFSVKESEVTA